MPEHKEDLALVTSLLSGSEPAFTRFYDTYFPRIFRFCRLRIGDEETCKDIVQQVLVNAMHGLSRYRGEASLFTWLCQIARNEISHWYKKLGHKQELTSSIDENTNLRTAIESMPAGIGGEFQSLHDDDLRTLVQTSLDLLPNSYGAALELKYIEGLSVSEIAHRLDIGEIAVQSLLARARKAFKTAFSDLEREFRTV
ncbi:RNA polymerase sigma factor [Microbulbifer pacificus]|uniref:RNA polymerase sigma factor n=1 Tax=Microbulbifer pacificus TaxID=407164 RepID=A0AAU0MWT8_9GAMM|nr:RNA polymerase sigma factor [Microbulbifer pacificus]WOX05135.1 RNA polymerase sigma factor [Microbulbifer pacificus]